MGSCEDKLVHLHMCDQVDNDTENWGVVLMAKVRGGGEVVITAGGGHCQWWCGSTHFNRVLTNPMYPHESGLLQNGLIHLYLHMQAIDCQQGGQSHVTLNKTLKQIEVF